MKQWPHSPIHIIDGSGTFMVTAATYKKQHFFNSERKIQFLHDILLEKAAELGWQLQAWAVFPNHYHFLAISSDTPENLPLLIRKIHGATSKHINDEDNVSGRKVWFQYWDSCITYQSSYYARLNYVHNNPVHHGLVDNALKYKWCSASWFEATSEEPFRKTVSGFKTDRIKIPDDF
ncbi:MAG TPA: transposase [bacterium]|nr:transposase [bacterium]